jgi:hypothetical protein
MGATQDHEVLGAELFKDPSTASSFVTKAGAFRALIDVLRTTGRYPRIHAAADPALRPLMDQPPLPISWMPAVAFQYLFRAMWAVLDPDEFRRVSRDSVLAGPMKVMRPIIEGTLRLFGASPAAFYRRMPAIMAAQVKGIEFEFIELDDTHALLEVRYPLLFDVPEPAFIYWEAVVGHTFDICRCTGTATTELLDDPDRNRARITLDWQL